jgi:predicted Rossmann fold nucleotide-binding protein DprA/Smf involved in DNA uptake
MSDDGRVEMLLRYGGLEIKLTGSPDDVTKSFLEFMSKMLPAYDIANRLVLNVDFEKLVRDLEGIVAMTPEGIIVTLPRDLLGERETILLHLLKTSVGHQLGRLDEDSLSLADILTETGGKPSTTAARLSELVAQNWVERVGRGQYRITTFGARSFQESVIPRIRTG